MISAVSARQNFIKIIVPKNVEHCQTFQGKTVVTLIIVLGILLTGGEFSIA